MDIVLEQMLGPLATWKEQRYSLAVHGAADLRFCIIGKSYQLGDDNPNRIRPTGVEV